MVSFGTSNQEMHERTCFVVQKEVEKEFSDYKVYYVFTSGKIIGKIEKREGIHVHNLIEGMETILAEGITSLTVQPTYVTYGQEYKKYKSFIANTLGRWRGRC
ncbi:sirohydrochlorin cobaltochelatase [[Clostridium] polysaccharolyticum]|uniref:Cobalt chelatase (CbiK) n=1 Tax=[Clostridium] polysaccharolyticum TaxID=29364 RepID=A0A1I0B9F9_9FIRM|nr:sirohydrochlorin cobaltochelatase [[Clostridium] polysaccharolyticum]SET03399.1 Cobalt chelatase (CbiK) [[Clostridium] polysaccharolyticum]